jgi:hypothetical protein
MALEWKRATNCEAGSCVLVAKDADGWHVRDGKDSDGPVLTFSDDEWRVFKHGVVNGDFDS